MELLNGQLAGWGVLKLCQPSNHKRTQLSEGELPASVVNHLFNPLWVTSVTLTLYLVTATAAVLFGANTVTVYIIF